MVLWFQKKPPLILGVDFNASAVNVVALRVGQKEWQVESIGSVPLAPQVIVDHCIQDALALGSALQSALPEMALKNSCVMLSLPVERVIEKTVLVEATLSEEELEAHMQLEAAASIPYPLAEVYRDFCVLGRNPKDPHKIEVLLVATRKENVDSGVRVLQEVGLNVHSIEVHSFALERMVNYLNSLKEIGETIAVLQCSSTIAFTVIHKGRAVYHREEISTSDLTPLLRRWVQLFLSTGYTETLHRILFIGSDPNSCRRISEHLSIPCSMFEPFQGMSFSSENVLPADTSCFALACGLALKGVLDDGH